jgi:hypothetical protein
MFCKGDPRVPEFYQRRRTLAEVTAKLKFHGKNRKGLSTKVLTAIDNKLAKVAANIDHLVDKENTAYERMSTVTAMGGGKRGKASLCRQRLGCHRFGLVPQEEASS